MKITAVRGYPVKVGIRNQFIVTVETDEGVTGVGEGGISGTWIGLQGLYDLAGKAMSLTAGTFREDVIDVLANDRHAVVLARHYFTRDGASKDYQTVHVYDVRDGKLAKCFEHPRDPAQFHDAWGSNSER